MLTFRIVINFMMLASLISPAVVLASDHLHISGSVYGSRNPDGSRRDDRGMDMSHVFRGGESKESQTAQSRAAEVDYSVSHFNSMASNSSLLVNPASRLQVASLTEGAEQIKILVEKRNRVRDEIVGRDHQEARQELVGIATDSLRAAREYYQHDEFEEGHIAATIADVALDLATSFTPGVSWGRDIYEAITGKSLIDGGELDTFSRSMAVLGVVTVGFGSKIGKAMKVMGRAMKGANAADTMRISEKLLASSRSVRGKISNAGIIHPGTAIPKNFDIEIAGEAFHVTSNGSKHMAEYITRLPESSGLPLRNDLVLASFEAAVTDAVTSGVWKTSLETQTLVRAGGWEFGFLKKTTPPYVQINHALMKW